ncbi:hypothetical protein JCM24511_05466 [Saitozyma sp. JCM 24511]|nr:hypothetical protein JCM24511_05466 [Saitozyma sp. JCM 24511]
MPGSSKRDMASDGDRPRIVRSFSVPVPAQTAQSEYTATPPTCSLASTSTSSAASSSTIPSSSSTFFTDSSPSPSSSSSSAAFSTPPFTRSYSYAHGAAFGRLRQFSADHFDPDDISSPSGSVSSLVSGASSSDTDSLSLPSTPVDKRSMSIEVPGIVLSWPMPLLATRLPPSHSRKPMVIHHWPRLNPMSSFTDFGPRHKPRSATYTSLTSLLSLAEPELPSPTVLFPRLPSPPPPPPKSILLLPPSSISIPLDLTGPSASSPSSPFSFSFSSKSPSSSKPHVPLQYLSSHPHPHAFPPRPFLPALLCPPTLAPFGTYPHPRRGICAIGGAGAGAVMIKAFVLVLLLSLAGWHLYESVDVGRLVEGVAEAL